MQTYERHKHYERIDIPAVDIAPENRYRNNQPYIQHIAIRGKGKYKQKDRYQHIRKTRRANIEKWTPRKHRKAAKHRTQPRMNPQ